MGKQERITKNKEQAARMKALGIRRTVGNCPCCHRPVPVGGRALAAHLPHCNGRPRARKR